MTDADVAPAPVSQAAFLEGARTVSVEHVMGTAIRVEVIWDGPRDELVNQVMAWFHTVDERFSLFRSDSEMSRLARGEIDVRRAHADIREVLELCEQARRDSGGVFDAGRHRPDGLLDPTGLVKGWSVDRAGELLTRAGVRDWSINAGGDVLTHGGPAPDQPWRIGIQHPLQRDAVAAVVIGHDLAVATSGAYERGEHIVDAREASARDGSRLLGVTVVGPALAFADAYATAGFAMGAGAATWLSGLPDYEGCVITAEQHVIWTAGIDRYRDPQPTTELPLPS